MEEEVDEERVFSLKSVIMTVTLPTVTANCCAVLLSTFFSRGLKATAQGKKSIKSAMDVKHLLGESQEQT